MSKLKTVFAVLMLATLPGCFSTRHYTHTVYTASGEVAEKYEADVTDFITDDKSTGITLTLADKTNLTVSAANIAPDPTAIGALEKFGEAALTAAAALLKVAGVVP